MTAPAPRAPDVSRHQRLGRAERREAILRAAASAFAREGFGATSMADISAAAGVSHLIVYRHFDSKETLYQAVLERAIEHLNAALKGPGAVGRYGITPLALLSSARAAPDAFAVLWRHAPREPAFASVADGARRRLVRATRGALTDLADPTEQRWAARATVAYLVESMLVWVEDGDDRLDDRFITATDAASRAGVRAWSRARVAEG